MKHDASVRALRGAATYDAFLRACETIVKNARHVRIDDAALDAYADSVRKPAFIPAWEDYLSDRIIDRGNGQYIKDKDARLKAALFELAQNCSVNAGYTYAGDDGVTRKWERGGSGAAALQDTLKKLWAHAAVPGVTQTDADIASAVMRPLLADVPEKAFREERISILSAFADAHSAGYLDYALNRARQPDGSLRFDYRTTLFLGESNPRGFQEDPFRKKLMLLPVMFASYAHSEGVAVELDIPVPADYRVPQTLHNIGVLRLSPHLVGGIEKGKLFGEDHDAVTELRAASVIAVERILQRARTRLATAHPGFRLEVNHLDADLWFAGRLFDKAAHELDEKKQKIRNGLEAIGQGSGFNKPGFTARTDRAINVYTMRF